MLGWPFKLKMRYKNSDFEWLCHLLISFFLSPSLAQSFIQICLDGVQEVRGIDVMLVQLDTAEKRQQQFQIPKKAVQIFFKKF